MLVRCTCALTSDTNILDNTRPVEVAYPDTACDYLPHRVEAMILEVSYA